MARWRDVPRRRRPPPRRMVNGLGWLTQLRLHREARYLLADVKRDVRAARPGKFPGRRPAAAPLGVCDRWHGQEKRPLVGLVNRRGMQKGEKRPLVAVWG